MKRIITLFFVTTLCSMMACTSDDVNYRTAPKPAFDVSATTVERGETVNFTDRSEAVEGAELVAWAWNFDFDNKENTAEVSSERNPSHVFNRVGTFTIRMVVTDSYGQFASKMETVTVETPYSELAHAEFSMPVEKSTINTSIQFTDGSVAAHGATIVSWEWNFGENDASISTEQNPTYAYTTSGSFTITLKVTDSQGHVSSMQRDLLILDPNDLVTIEWKKPLLGTTQNTVSPALSPDGNTVYMWADQTAADAYDTSLKAYDVETGNEVWTYEINKDFPNQNANGGVRQVFASPVVGTNGDIYICARDLKNNGTNRKSFMYAVKSDGTKRWHYAFGIDANFNYMTPAIAADGTVYVGHLTNGPFAIAAIDPATGAKKQSISLNCGVRSGISLDRSGNIYFCSTGTNGMFSYSASGSQNWQYNANVATTGGDIAIGSDGTVYTVVTGSTSGIVVAVTSSGDAKWEFALPGEAQYGGVAIGADGTLFANGGKATPGTANTGGVVALNSDGTLKWHFATEEDVNNCVPLVDNRGYVHFITDKGTYYVVDDNGQLYGMKSLGTKSYASPVMNASGKVCIAVDEDSKSYMVCLDTGAAGYADSAWPMKGQNPQRTHLQK